VESGDVTLETEAECTRQELMDVGHP
jgi:hypothetical protein